MPLLAKIFNILRRVQKGARTLAEFRLRAHTHSRKDAKGETLPPPRARTHSSGGKSARWLPPGNFISWSAALPAENIHYQQTTACCMKK
jgi:hypothetical protein